MLKKSKSFHILQLYTHHVLYSKPFSSMVNKINVLQEKKILHRVNFTLIFGGFITAFSVIISCIDVHVGFPVVASIHGNCQGSWNGDESCHRGGFQ